jgi:hypothetical protein
MGFKRVTVVGWVDEDSVGFPPGFWGGQWPGDIGGGPIIPPGRPLPPRPPEGGGEYPGRPGQGLPWPGRPVDPGWGVDEGIPGYPPREPKAYDVGEHPEEPGTEGTWAVVIYNDRLHWVFVPRTEQPEVDPD